MAVLCSEIWLLIGVVFVLQLPVIKSQLCQEGLTFHALTGSCMALIRNSYTYFYAKQYCYTYYSSSTTKGRGHLVFIFDKATDDFVKDLLNEGHADTALIGLNDRGRTGEYRWGDDSPIPANYTRWKDNPHINDDKKHAVVMTKDGWEEYDRNYPAYFVCQGNADFPTPRMVCPAAEIGQESPDITCTVNTYPALTITSLRFMKTAEVVAWCDGHSCRSSQGYYVVDIRKSQETSRSVSWTLKLRNVTIKDETDWTCSVKYNNNGSWVASKPCSLEVYIKPADIQCSYVFVQAMVRTTCTAAKVYPQAGCTWQVNSGYWKLDVNSQTSSNGVISAEGYYRATCNAEFSISNAPAGTYVIAVVMTPNLGTGTVTEISVSVAPPQQPPQLYLAGQRLESLWVEVVENQTLNITCRVPGGVPGVYRTIIKCNNTQRPFESDGSSVTMYVRVTRAFDGQNCTCSALHAARYTQTSSVEIRVTYPATVDSFRIYGSSSSTDIKRGDEITFACTASGRPTSHLVVQRQNGLMVTSPFTGYPPYKKTATCSDMGSYVCLASNTVEDEPHEDRKVVHLQVKCAPEHCSDMSSPRFPAAVGAPSVSIKICVRAYPAPTLFSLYKGNTTDHRLKADKFQAYFNFTNEGDGLGDITVMISHLAQADIGDYLLYSAHRPTRVELFHSHLKFRLFAQGPPICPTNLTVLQADPDSVTLSWIRGFNGGLNQTFTVLRVDSPNDTASPGFTELGSVEDQDDINVYAVTGLSESTTYTFALKVTNEKGSRNCSHVQVNVSTSASAAPIAGHVVTFVVVPAIIILLLVILVVAVVVAMRRRRHEPKKSDYVTDTARTGERETSREAANESDGDNVYANTGTRGINTENTIVKPAREKSEEAEASDTYAQVNKQNKTENKKVKPARKKSEEAEASNTYAQANKQNKTAKQVRGSPDGKSASEQGQESLYTRLTRNINLKGHKKQKNEQTYNELAEVYPNASKVAVAHSSADADQDNVYANVKTSSPNKKETTKEKKKDNDRTVNEDGLVYVTVEINKRTTYPEIVSATKPPARVPSAKTDEQPEEVEYIAINFSPGAKQQ